MTQADLGFGTHPKVETFRTTESQKQAPAAYKGKPLLQNPTVRPAG